MFAHLFNVVILKLDVCSGYRLWYFHPGRVKRVECIEVSSDMKLEFVKSYVNGRVVLKWLLKFKSYKNERGEVAFIQHFLSTKKKEEK